MTAEPSAPPTPSNWIKVAGLPTTRSPETSGGDVTQSVVGEARGEHPSPSAEGSVGDLYALRRQFEPQLQRSVDAFEVAVALEADGISDDEALRYSARDVFELARMLRSAAPPADRVPATPRTDWYPKASIAVLRGFTFTVGALTVMTVVGLGAGSAAAVLVLAVNVFGVAIMQAVSFLSYVLLERSGAIRDPSVLRPLMRVLVLPLLVSVVAGIAMGPVTGVFAGAALAYLIGMFMVLILGRPVLVAVIVLPVAVLGTIDSVQPDHFLTALVVGLWLVGAAVLVITSFVLTRPEGGRIVIKLGTIDYRAALPFAVASLTTGVVVVGNLLMVSGALPLQHHGTRPWLLASLPFLIPVSLAELLVVGVRRPLHQVLGFTSSPRDFRRLGRRSCLRMWLLHLSVGAVVLALVVPLLSEGSLGARVLLGVSFLLVGTLLTASLMISSGDAIRYELWLLGGTAALLLGARLTQAAPGSTHQLAVNVGILGVAAAVGVCLSVHVTGAFARYR